MRAALSTTLSLLLSCALCIGIAQAQTISPSPSGTMIPYTAAKIYDSNTDLWTLANGFIYKNGSLAASSGTALAVFYSGGSIYEETKACTWFLWSNGSWTTTTNPSPSTTPACTPSTSTASGGTTTGTTGGGTTTGTNSSGGPNISQFLATLNTLGAQQGISPTVLNQIAQQVVLDMAGTGTTNPTTPTQPTSPTGATQSASGTTIPSATQIVDASSNVWTVVGGVVEENGSPAGFSQNVITLLYLNGIVIQENSSQQWYSWTGSGWNALVGDPRTAGTTGTGGTGTGTGTGGGTTGTIPNSGFGVKIVGNKFTDLSGNVLQLQGENVSGLEGGNDPGFWDGFYRTTEAQWKTAITKWQMNIIRIPVDEHAWLTNAKSSGGTPYQTIVATVVNNITSAGAYVIIDLHHAAPNSYTGSLTGHNAPGYSDGQPGYLDQDNSPTFWSQIASTYKNNHAVLFEMFNEPYAFDDGSYAYLLNGSGSTMVTFYDQPNGQGGGRSTGDQFKVAGFQQILNAIRQTGATNVVLWSSPSWDSDLGHSLTVRPTDPLSPSQIAATIHYANGTNAQYTTVLNAGFPILMTEYYNLTSRGGYAWAQANKIGYVIWGANNWSSNSDLSNIDNFAPWDNNEWGNNGRIAWPLN
jgi:hypothetical protein